MTATAPPPRTAGPGQHARLLDAEGSRTPDGTDIGALVQQARAQDALLWLEFDAGDGEAVRAAGDACGLDPGLVEGALAARQRSRLHRSDEAAVLALRTCRLDAAEESGRLPRVNLSGHVVLLAAPGVTLLVRHGESDLRAALDGRLDRLRPTGGALADPVRLVTAVVLDQYEEVAEALEESVEDADPEPEGDRSPAETRRRHERKRRHRRLAAAHHLHRQIFRLRRAVGPAALAFDAAVEHLPESEYGIGSLREASHRLQHLASQSEQLGQLLDSARDAWSAEVSVGQNDDMRRISAVAALVAVPTLVVGNYGMNFDHMPELHWLWGYPAVVVATAAVCAALYAVFRRLEWL